ncbi:uncharacterized protein V6R79_005560 [Siganus canaliculatus]
MTSVDKVRHKFTFCSNTDYAQIHQIQFDENPHNFAGFSNEDIRDQEKWQVQFKFRGRGSSLILRHHDTSARCRNNDLPVLMSDERPFILAAAALCSKDRSTIRFYNILTSDKDADNSVF